MDEDLTGVAIEDEAEIELQSALTKAIKVKQKKGRKDPDKVSYYRFLQGLYHSNFSCSLRLLDNEKKGFSFFNRAIQNHFFFIIKEDFSYSFNYLFDGHTSHFVGFVVLRLI